MDTLLHGASRVRLLSPDQFCKQGFVIGKASEAGFGNEMYKILTAAALSIMGKYPFGDYITYADFTFTLPEVKHLWRKNDCVRKYGRHLVMRADDFEKPSETNVLCSNWRKWKHPIIWFKGTTDAVASQFFLKNVHVQMRKSASTLFGSTGCLRSRPNVIGELLRVMISPSPDVQRIVNWVVNEGRDPHIAVHMRMLMNRSLRAVTTVLNCIKTTIARFPKDVVRPRVVLISDTPSLISDLMPKLLGFTEVLHFEYKKFKGNISGSAQDLGFRVKDWGPAPRWVAFVDFFLASRATHAVITGAQRRVGTTYAQLIAALAAAHQLDDDQDSPTNFSFISSFQNNLLHRGLQNQVGWGHVWNRFAGQLSCHSQPNQCALTPLLPPGLETTIDDNRLQAYCKAKKAISRIWTLLLKWRSWIKICLSSSRASILVNGSPTSEFFINRGLRQGDPLSPFLFILVLEGLHNAFADAVGTGLIIGNNTPFNYLGLPIGSNMKSIASWKMLIDHFRSEEISLEKACLLSIGGSSDPYQFSSVHGPNIVGSSNFFHSKGIILNNSFRFNAGCGTRIRFWKDIWVGEALLFIRTNIGVQNLAFFRDMLNEIGQLNIVVIED
ncbi:hypothetical protein Tco_0680076 [Tanacetum coccineum]|uniref:Reverse transcriptase domain-containing protein n=1 Tax=Tanacetum coccineum TaxID=301880 RepID=A0ABQ4XKA9_9ASTR